MLLKYSVGIPLMAEPRRCRECSLLMDIYGQHALVCRKASGGIDKHDSIKNGIFRLMKNANLACSVEARNPMNDSRERPGDIYMPEFDMVREGHGDAFFDVSVINTCAESHIIRSSKGQLEGSKIRYIEKMVKYSDLGSRMRPLIVEHTGGWHPFSYQYLKEISERMAGMTRLTAAASLSKLLTTSSFCLQRHQGTQLARRCLGPF